MAHEFDEAANVHVDRDARGLARGLVHTDEVFRSKARTAQLAAREYLEKYRTLLGVETDQLEHLGLRPGARPIDSGVQYRFLAEVRQFDMTTVTFGQTCLGLRVWEAGIAVHLKQDHENRFRAVSAQSTLHSDLFVKMPSEAALKRIDPVSADDLARHLGLGETSEDFERSSLRIERQELFVYRYEGDKRARLLEPSPRKPERAEKPEKAEKKGNGNGNGHPSARRADGHEGHNGHDGQHTHDHGGLYRNPPLPPVPESITEGGHYVVAAVYFVLGVPNIPELRWVALVEAETHAVLLVRAFVESIDGLVFVQDPVTTSGGPLPAAGNAALNPLRSAVVLRGLVPPAFGSFSLTGDRVQLKDVEPPAVPPPLEPAGTDFDFNARTDRFAAVNASIWSPGCNEPPVTLRDGAHGAA